MYINFYINSIVEKNTQKKFESILESKLLISTEKYYF